MSDLQDTVLLTPKQAREYRLQCSDINGASEAPEINSSRYARTCDLVNVSINTTHVTASQVVDYYSRRYTGLLAQTPVPAPYTARQAERDILDAGVPYNYVRSMTKAGFTRESVEAGIKAYFALKAVQYEKNAAKLALVLSR